MTMKTRSILLLFALGAIIAMAFTFSSSTEEGKIEIPKNLNTSDAKIYEGIANLPLGTELTFYNTDGTERWTEQLTEERKTQMLNNVGKEKANVIDCGGGVMVCAANRWYCCVSNSGTAAMCFFAGLGNCSNP